MGTGQRVTPESLLHVITVGSLRLCKREQPQNSGDRALVPWTPVPSPARKRTLEPQHHIIKPHEVGMEVMLPLGSPH